MCKEWIFMNTRSHCSSWTCSILLQSMRDLRSDHTMQETQTFLEVAQPYSRAAKCRCWTSVFHTHQPHPWVRGVKVPQSSFRGEGGGDPTHSPNRKHTGSQFTEWDQPPSLPQGGGGIISSQTRPGEPGRTKTWPTSKTIPKVPMKCSLYFYFFLKVWGKWWPSLYPSLPLCPPCGPDKLK